MCALQAGATKVFVDGDWIGIHRDPENMTKILKQARREGGLGRPEVCAARPAAPSAPTPSPPPPLLAPTAASQSLLPSLHILPVRLALAGRACTPRSHSNVCSTRCRPGRGLRVLVCMCAACVQLCL